MTTDNKNTGNDKMMIADKAPKPLAIAGAHIPEKARHILSLHCDPVWFRTEGIVYDAIACHPDIFFCVVDNGVVAAPNAPARVISFLTERGINVYPGETVPEGRYPKTARYNAVFAGNYLIHNLSVTDKNILFQAEGKIKLHVQQGYCRCNLLHLGGHNFICSDAGIQRRLVDEGLNSLFVNPSDIILPGQKHGFFGGAAGVFGNNLFVIGSLNRFAGGGDVRLFLEMLGMGVVELCDTPLFDGGGILFM